MASNQKDLTGKRFGRLVVIEDSGERQGTNIKWLCRCDCGNETKVAGGDLMKCDTESCGCLRKETAKKRIVEYHDKASVEGTTINLLTAKLSSANTTGEKGVYLNKKSGRWRATICFKKRQIHLGYFANKQDAINARKEAEEKYFKPILEKYGKTQ